MPEGNEIHRWAARHEAAFRGKVVRADGPQGRFTASSVLDGRRLRQVRAVGKHLGYDFGSDRILHIHLGLQGDFTDGSGPLPAVRGALRLRLWNEAAVKRPVVPGESRRHAWYSEDDGTGHIPAAKIAWVELRGPMDCSIFTETMWSALLARLGPDPLNGDRPDAAIAKISRSRKPIGALLMDQSVIAGIGNIYRAELLFRARLNPLVPGREVEERLLRSIWKDAQPLMQAGMVDRRIVTTRPAERPSNRLNNRRRPRADVGATGEFAAKVAKEEVHYVYRRHGQPCFLCGAKVQRAEMEGRNLFWCPCCQATKSR